MSKPFLVLAALSAAAAAALAATAAPAASGPGLTPEQVIGARQASFRLSAAAFGSMKGPIDSGADVQNQVFAARALANWAQTLPTLFPAGTGQGQTAAKTAAKAEIWSNRADFEAKAADYAAAAGKLAELAQANDKAGFAAQWGEVRKACGACHDLYRAK